MKTVIVINGRPRAGKDSTVLAMQQILKGAGIATSDFSSIDPVRFMLQEAGIDLSAKTPEDRALLAEVGFSLEKHSHWRSQRCFRMIYGFFEDNSSRPAVMFLHVREPEIIARITDRVERRKWRMLTVLVKSIREENVISNAADLGVEGMKYHEVLENNGTLDDLAHACDKLLFKQQVIEQLSLLHR